MSSGNNDYDYEDKFQEKLKEIKTNSMKQKLVAIKNLIVKRLALEKEFKAQHFKLEAKYEALYKPFYDKRAKVIEGSTEVTVEEIQDQLEHVNIKDPQAPNAEVGVPQFWLQCLQNTDQFGSLINKKDEEILKHLKDITVDFDESGSFKLHFHFSANQYFDHTTLTREFLLDSEKLSISKITSSKIEWKSEDLNPTIEKKKKKIKNSKNILFIFFRKERSQNHNQSRNCSFLLQFLQRL
jgi:nucleosome assembly protein 1-like 1